MLNPSVILGLLSIILLVLFIVTARAPVKVREVLFQVVATQCIGLRRFYSIYMYLNHLQHGQFPAKVYQKVQDEDV